MKTAFIILITCAFFAGCDSRSGHEHNHAPGCRHSHTPEQRHRDGHEHKSDHENENETHSQGCKDAGDRAVTVPESVQTVMGLKTARAEKRRVSSSLLLHGRFELLPDARQGVASPVEGRLEIKAKPLARVGKGDILFTVTSPDLVARENEISILEKRLAVYKGIKTRNAALENEIAVKRAERAAIVADADEKNGIVTVRAAAAGIVESFLAKTGDWMSTGSAVLQIADPKALQFKALVPPEDAGRLAEGMDARVGSITGKVRLGIADESGLVPAYVVFDRDIEALAGARAQASVETDAGGGAKTAVPSKAIVRSGLEFIVFARDSRDRERFVALHVTPGETGGGWTAVDGIADGTEVAVDGAYELKLALPGPQSKSAGHFHADGTFHDGEH